MRHQYCDMSWKFVIEMLLLLCVKNLNWWPIQNEILKTDFFLSSRLFRNVLFDGWSFMYFEIWINLCFFMLSLRGRGTLTWKIVVVSEGNVSLLSHFGARNFFIVVLNSLSSMSWKWTSAEQSDFEKNYFELFAELQQLLLRIFLS